MRLRSLTLLPLVAAAGIATPAVAQTAWFTNPPSFYYQNPNGTYDSLADMRRSLWGVPCGIECTDRAAARWGLVPAPRHHYYYRRHYQPY